jgi:hypothetical protein
MEKNFIKIREIKHGYVKGFIYNPNSGEIQVLQV